MTLSAIVYDCEIIKCIPLRDEEKDPSLQYCNGWHDHANMGISVIGAYDYLTNQLRAYVSSDMAFLLPACGVFEDFKRLIKARGLVVGFNSVAFDDRLCAAHGIDVKTNYDILREVRSATGQPADYVQGVTRSGYSLNSLAKANLGAQKTGHGALAPQQWQQGDYYEVIRYCLDDVMLTGALFDKRTELVDPNDGLPFALREPVGA